MNGHTRPSRLHARSAATLLVTVLWLCAAALLPGVGVGVGAAEAQMVPAPPELDVSGGRTEPGPAEIRDMDLVEKLGDALPMDIEFVDEAGQAVRLGDYFAGDKPVVLNLGYYGCPMLCGQVVRGLANSLRDLEERDGWLPGRDYEVVTLSFDHREDASLASEAKQRTMPMFIDDEQAGRGWHFLTGAADDVRRVADAVGFPYAWSQAEQQYVHPAAVMLVTPDGRVSRYLYGVSFPSATLRLSLVEASEGKVGSAMDRVLLFCYSFDHTRGEYTLAALNLMRLGGALTVIVLAIGIGVMAVRGARRQTDHQANGHDSPSA